jgi:hypothetical protein
MKMTVAVRSTILVLVAAAWCWGSAAVADTSALPQRQEIESTIHDYLMHHPDVLIAALRSSQGKAAPT